MQVALLSEVMRSATSQDAAPSANARSQVVSEDFSAILAKRTESASVRETDTAAAQRARAVSSDRDEDETKPADSNRDTTVSDTEDPANDPTDVAENAWLAYSVSNPAEQAHAKASAASSDLEALAKAVQAAIQDGGSGASTTGQNPSATLAQLVASAGESGTPASAELMKEILAALASLNGGDAGMTDNAFVKALESSLKEGKAASQDTLQALLLTDAAQMDADGAQTADLAQDTPDLNALLKTLSLALSKEQAAEAAQVVADEPIQAQPVKSASTDVDANAADVRLVAVPAANAEATAVKAAAVQQTAPAATATPATLEKVVLDNVMYLTSRGEKTMVVQLSPPALGDLRIEVSSAKNTVNVSLLSGSPTVRDLLESHAVGLRESLARNGIEVASVAVLPALAGHAAGQQYAGHAAPDFSRATPAVRLASAASSDSTGTSDERYRRVTPHEGSLNLFV